MNARMRRIASDFEQIKRDFANHKHIIVTPAGSEPPEKYNITYFVNGIYLMPDGRVEKLSKHEVEITLHAEYPRYKPICRIKTYIWHPNFRDGQVCIGDIWGAGESLSDIIINIGDMIQYKSWNSSSPLSAEAAQWAIENKHLLPVGNIELYKADYSDSRQEFEIDLFDDEGEVVEAEVGEPEILTLTEDMPVLNENAFNGPPPKKPDENDFDITAEDLAGIEFVPSAERMQTITSARIVKDTKLNFKTVLVKGIIWAFIGAILGFGVSELLDSKTDTIPLLRQDGYPEIADFMLKLDQLDEDAGIEEIMMIYQELYDETGLEEDEIWSVVGRASRKSTAIFAAVIALFVGLFLGIGEGIYYGSIEKALRYALVGALISLVVGYLSGYIAQFMYAIMSASSESAFSNAFVRGVGWAVMGVGIGLAVGLIKPEKKRILYCILGGTAGAFIGGILFDPIYFAFTSVVENSDVISRGVGIVIMGTLIGLGVGLLEQFAKAAWLKVIRGEFEGKEYLVFNGTTSIGNSGKNTIVLFKDKLVGPSHCDIILEGSKYVLVDKGTPMGTLVNGQKIVRHILKHGDSIAVGNSVLVFNTKTR